MAEQNLKPMEEELRAISSKLSVIIFLLVLILLSVN